MASEKAPRTKPKCPTLEFTKQDFLQEAKFVIAKHHEKINENKVQGTSINVFKNKHPKVKSYKYIPFEVNQKEALDVIQEHRMILRHMNYPKEPLRSEYFKEPSEQQTSAQEKHVLNVKDKYKFKDCFTKVPENIKLSTIMTDIESVSKQMENERNTSEKPRSLEFLHTLPTHSGLSLQPSPSFLRQHRESGTMHDWRGIVSSRLTGAYIRSLSASSVVLKDITKTFKKKEPKPVVSEPKLEPRLKSALKTYNLDSKVKRIGPHIEIFQVFKGRHRLIITKRVIKLVTVIQAYIRGWLERKRIQRLAKKALYHGPNLKAVMNMYRKIIHHVRHRLGLWRTRQIINFSELEEWMDRKKFYETMFAKREDWQGLERSELLKYFNECGHFPTQSQIDDCWDLFHKGSPERHPDVIRKSIAIEMLFTLYPPQGARVRNNVRLRSTWLRPIVNGEEGYKYIVNGHPVLKRANIRIVGRLVANSLRERKMRQFFKS